MARIPQNGSPARRSKRWTQFYVNEQPEVLNRVILDACGLSETNKVTWVSPLKDDDYAEYSDQDFIDKLELPQLEKPLREFWPTGGANWDALAKGNGQVFIVESKANLPELATTPTQAKGESRLRILAAFTEVQSSVGTHANRRNPELWANAFYQYANRIAHLYFLRELNSINAHLLFLDFINDPDSGDDAVRCVADWHSLTQLVEACLGIPKANRLRDYIHHIHLDVEDHATAMNRGV